MLSLIAAGTFTVLLGLDVLLKQHVEENIKSGEEKKVLGGKVVIRKVYNKGFLLNSLESHPVLIKTVSILGGGRRACVRRVDICQKRTFHRETGHGYSGGRRCKQSV